MSITYIEPTPIEGIITQFPSYKILEQLRLEDTLNLEMMPVPFLIGLKEIDDTAIYLKFNGSTPIKDICELPISLMIDLFEKSNDLRPTPLVNYLTALRIHFACINDTITLLYEPIYLERVAYHGASQKYLFDAGENVPKYILNDTTFESISDNEFTNWTLAYQTMMKIKHNDTENHLDFVSLHDVENMVFPFQAIFALIFDNLSDSVKMFNSIAKVSYDGDYTIKHRILLLSEPINKGRVNFTRKFANRSHLCPPCNSVNFGFDLAL